MERIKLSRHEIIRSLRNQGVHKEGYSAARKAVEDAMMDQAKRDIGKKAAEYARNRHFYKDLSSYVGHRRSPRAAW